MKMLEFIEYLNLNQFCCSEYSAEREITAAYCGDLLSDVMGNAPPDSVWFTIQSHLNIVAVAQLRDIAVVVLINGIEPDPQTLDKAKILDITICGSGKTSAELCMALAGKL
ncbi:MAG: hypothetical protein L3J71_02225 [Victivallaceae bacterium]|nr:hypothetical protein [Victivallaceae bacterium]